MQELIKRAMKRDADAFSELIECEMQHLYKTARAILKTDEDAADAIQDTILTLWEKLDTLNDPDLFRTWMTRILINKCNDIRRRNTHYFLADMLPERGAQPEEYLNLEWRQALSALDEKYRTVMLLYYVEDFKTSEIAQILELPEATVRTRLRRGRARLQAAYLPQAEQLPKITKEPGSGKAEVIG